MRKCLKIPDSARVARAELSENVISKNCRFQASSSLNTIINIDAQIPENRELRPRHGTFSCQIPICDTFEERNDTN
jgi:hypothetical protein